MEAIAADLSPIDFGGSLGLGSDVAIYHLKEAITDVTPIPLAQAPLTTADIGKRFLGIGYGAKDVLQDVFRVGPLQRRAGYMTMRALTGAPAHTIWPTFEDFVHELEFLVGSEAPPWVLPELRKIYDAELLEGYEAWAGLLLRSGSRRRHHRRPELPRRLGRSAGGPGRRQGHLRRGLRRLLLPPADLRPRHLLRHLGPQGARNDPGRPGLRRPLRGHHRKGSCDGTVATRCTDKFEGDRRVARIDCADLGMECRPGWDGVVACFAEDEPAEQPPLPPGRPLPPTIEQVRAQISVRGPGDDGQGGSAHGGTGDRTRSTPLGGHRPDAGCDPL